MTFPQSATRRQEERGGNPKVFPSRGICPGLPLGFFRERIIAPQRSADMHRDGGLTEFSGPDGHPELCLCKGGELLCASCGTPFEDIQATAAICLACKLAVHASSCIEPIGICSNCFDGEL
jgi:hypothetical protein